MKKIISVLLLSIFIVLNIITPTSVFADVVIGDNDDVIVNENAYILGRKLALMESVPNLINGGATQLTISNTSDLDEYLDYLWDEINDAKDYLVSGDWVDDVPVAFRNEALENITSYIDYVDDRSNIFAELLRDPTTTLLKTYVIGNNLPKTEYHPNYNTLNTFRKLSQLNSDTPLPNPPDEYLVFLNYINKRDNTVRNSFWFYDFPNQYYIGRWGTINNYTPWTDYSYFIPYTNSVNFTNINNTEIGGIGVSNIIDININSTSENNYSTHFSVSSFQNVTSEMQESTILAQHNGVKVYPGTLNKFDYANTSSYTYEFSGSLTVIFNNLIKCFKNVNIYVDGVPWSIVNSNANPLMDIDGFLQIYNNSNPPQYDIVDGTKIDYDELYDTIYNAIINALPIDQQDITYYDSHDTIYSPTIINNYGSDAEGETDFIESILDYAIIPKFDTAMLAPIETPFENGVRILNVSIGYGTIPHDILIVLGALCVLGLFVIIINRMLE